MFSCEFCDALFAVADPADPEVLADMVSNNELDICELDSIVENGFCPVCGSAAIDLC